MQAGCLRAKVLFYVPGAPECESWQSCDGQYHPPPGLLMAYKTYLSSTSVSTHIFRCLSEEEKQLSFKAEYPERKQETTG